MECQIPKSYGFRHHAHPSWIVSKGNVTWHYLTESRQYGGLQNRGSQEVVVTGEHGGRELYGYLDVEKRAHPHEPQGYKAGWSLTLFGRLAYETVLNPQSLIASGTDRQYEKVVHGTK